MRIADFKNFLFFTENPSIVKYVGQSYDHFMSRGVVGSVGIQENSLRNFSKISDKKWTFEISATFSVTFYLKNTKISDKKETFEISATFFSDFEKNWNLSDFFQ